MARYWKGFAATLAIAIRLWPRSRGRGRSAGARTQLAASAKNVRPRPVTDDNPMAHRRAGLARAFTCSHELPASGDASYAAGVKCMRYIPIFHFAVKINPKTHRRFSNPGAATSVNRVVFLIGPAIINPIHSRAPQFVELRITAWYGVSRNSANHPSHFELPQPVRSGRLAIPGSNEPHMCRNSKNIPGTNPAPQPRLRCHILFPLPFAATRERKRANPHQRPQAFSASQTSIPASFGLPARFQTQRRFQFPS